jgi:hypothetical protein
MPDSFSPPLSPTASALVNEEPPLWEFRLFAQVLADEIGLLKGTLPTVAVHREPGFQQGASWIGGELQRLNDISAGVTGCLNADHLDAWGLPGQPGDAHAVVSFARQVSGFYRQTQEWQATMMRADLHPLLHPVAQEAARFGEPLLGPLGALSPDLLRQCDAILALPPGAPAALEVNVVFDGFDRSRYTEALQQASEGYRRGRR